MAVELLLEQEELKAENHFQLNKALIEIMQYDKLKSSKSFAQLRKSGSSFVAPAFVILAQKTNCCDTTVQIGFTASKKIGNAIKRALARRRLKAALNEINPQLLENLNSYQLNIIARHKALDVDFEKLVFYFSKTLKNIQKNSQNNAKKD
ncbi:MAG: Ribonuclease P protein component [Proteobacteria bacterium]|nr:MAG: Ribonuclease P protein component [Pseudomonadota bacterium]